MFKEKIRLFTLKVLNVACIQQEKETDRKDKQPLAFNLSADSGFSDELM